MNKIRFVSLLCMISILSVLLMGCGETVDSPIVGKWAYIHDKETAVLELKSNGSAVYNNEKYSFTEDGQYIILSSGKDKQKLRYELVKDDLYLYEPATYIYASEGEPDGLIGVWANENKWSYEFTKEGTFREDGYFPGYYTVDEANSTIKLVYNDHFEDTTIYYSLDGNRLLVEYPWRMVRMN